jgi:ABC-type branched-subunit amino acid transport system substrate-binding protein
VPDALRVNRPDALFDLIAESDCREPETARLIARKIHSNPRVLAVLGHSTSGTTMEAGPSYADAGIPLIMPLATAKPASLYAWPATNGERRLPNYVRLQPSDDLTQAPAIAYVIRRLNPQRVFFLVSDRYMAGLYSTQLETEVARSLKELAPVSVHVAEDDEETASTVQMMAGARDVVFYSGSATHAKQLIPKLSAAYNKTAPENRPALVLPEACDGFEREFHQSGFRIYRTGPLETSACRPDDGHREYLSRIPGLSTAGLPIATLYGFDAVNLVSMAIRKCGSTAISRTCVLNQLRNSRAVAGICGGYSFREGENVLSGYHVFWSEGADIPFRTGEEEAHRTSREITPGDIIRMRAED